VKRFVGAAIDLLEKIYWHESWHASGALRVVKDFGFDMAIGAEGGTILFHIASSRYTISINDVMCV